jgi:hypothetical protein
MIVHKINFVNYQLIFHNPQKAGTYIKTPKFLDSKKCLINIENEDDDKCLLYCYMYHLS